MAAPETFTRVRMAVDAQRVELPQRAKYLCAKVNESLYKFAHEPSLAGHRMQEHVYKTVPILEKEKQNIKTITERLNGVMFDLDYTSNFLDQLDDSIQNSTQTREIVSELASKISAASSRMN